MPRAVRPQDLPHPQVTKGYLLIARDMSALAFALAGASEAAIAETTGHKSLDMVRRYTRKADPFRRGVSRKVGL